MDKNSVEMSAYIDLQKYHRCEPSHPYYPEMYEKLLWLINGNGDGKKNILEIGAGTGAFTKQLSNNLELSITAVELDKNCYKFAKNTLRSVKNVKLIHEDGIMHHNGKRYDAIVSCVSHHHIPYEQKDAYWRNIRRNLKPSGIYVVGDEFIDHFTTEKRRVDALGRLHNHIIDRAQEQGNFDLVELERINLEQGIIGTGECKVSCRIFEKNLCNNGFAIAHKEKIGPLEKNNGYGIYVYNVKKSPG